MSKSQAALANLALLALANQPPAKTTPAAPVNNAINPTATANLAMAALTALVPALGVAQVVDNTAELFEVEEVQSLEVIVVVNGTSHSVFSI